MAAFVVAGWKDMPEPNKKRGWDDDSQRMLELMLGQVERSSASASLETLDLLGGSSSNCYKSLEPHELDLEAPLPVGWEKCLDLKTGQIYYLNRSNGRSSSSDPTGHPLASPRYAVPAINFRPSVRPDETPSSAKSAIFALSDATFSRLGLHLTVDLNSPPQQDPVPITVSPESDKRPSGLDGLVGPAASKVEKAIALDTSEMITVGCAKCLMFVMLSRTDPRCPNCGSCAALDFLQPMAKKAKPT